MFFLHELERTITLHPSFNGPHIDDYIFTQLLTDVEGKHTGEYYVVMVMDSHEKSEGRVIPGTGMTEFKVHYKALVWKLFREEVLDGVVTDVVGSGFSVQIGPITVFVARSMISSALYHDGNATPPQWTDGHDQVIERGTHVRVKIKGIRPEIGEMFAIATIKEDYLGPLVP